MKSILVTGATGFIGTHVLPFFLAKGYEVHALCSSQAPRLNHRCLTWHKIDLHSEIACTHLIKKIKPTHLLHLAWFAKPKEYWFSPLNIQWLQTSIKLLEIFTANGGKRAVLVGTCAEYDWQFNHCHEERTPCLPHTLYGRSKYALYLISEILARQNEISLAWGRLFFLFGPHEPSTRLIASLIKNLLNQEMFQLNNGNHIRDFLYVIDAAEALVSLLESNCEGVVNIASGKPISLLDLSSEIAGLLEKRELISANLQIEPPTGEPKILTADTHRLNNEVKWTPKYPLKIALQETINWWKENG